MKLYYLKGACPLASQIVLEWMNVGYELEEVTREQTKTPQFLALNPVGSVPVLVDDDFVLSQSVAIMEYLAELHPESGLHGTTAKERAEVRRWLSFCNSDLHRTFSLNVSNFYLVWPTSAWPTVIIWQGNAHWPTLTCIRLIAGPAQKALICLT